MKLEEKLDELCQKCKSHHCQGDARNCRKFTSRNAFIASQEQRERANIAFNRLLAGEINFEEYLKEVQESMEEFYKKLEEV